MGNPLFLLSEGQLKTKEPYWGLVSSSEPTPELVYRLVQDPANVFVLTAPERTYFTTAREAFEKARLAAGRPVARELRIYDQRAQFAYLIVELGRPSRSGG